MAMRLNRGPVECPECKTMVNPYVVQRGEIIILVECPTCREEFSTPMWWPEENANTG